MANIEDLRDRSVSSGTLKSEDLIPKFLGVLKTYGKDKYDTYIKENPEVEDWENLDDETMGWVVDELTDLLNEIAPDGCYFGASEGDGADFGFWSMSNESKKSEADGNKDIFTLDLTRIDADGDEEGLDDMQAAQTFYDEDDAIKAAKELADSYKDGDGVVQVIVMAGEQEKPNGDIVGDSFDIYWASSSDKQTTTDYRKKARYAAFDNKMDYYAKGGKSEGNDDDKGCKGKDCKDDKTKKNEADATFKVGDFVNYDAESDGKDVYDSFIPCEVVDVNDDGTLGLCVYGSYVDEEGLGENASASCCSKLDHYAGMVDANTYYTDGKFKAYKGGWEILITDKELDPKVYEFIGTMDDLSEVIDFDDYYGGENFVYDEDLRDALGATGVDTDGVDFADMSGDLAKASDSPEESKQSERAIPVPSAIKQKINDGITQCLSAIKETGAVANPIKVTNSTDKPELSSRDTLAYAPSYVYRVSGMERNFVGVMFHVEKGDQYGQLFIGWDKKNNRPFVWAGGATFDSYDSFCNDFKRDFSECFKATESKKSESLTLKQKELKDMARFGQAEDITTISDEEAKALRKKGIETIGISRGTYGMNGALLRDNEGKKYVITARSSNLFYFV